MLSHSTTLLILAIDIPLPLQRRLKLRIGFKFSNDSFSNSPDVRSLLYDDGVNQSRLLLLTDSAVDVCCSQGMAGHSVDMFGSFLMIEPLLDAVRLVLEEVVEWIWVTHMC